MALSLPTNHSAQQSCPLWRDMSVTTGENAGRGGAKQKATDTSKPVKNVMVFVKDLASTVAVEEHHSWIRCFGSSGEMVNIKGLCRSLPFRRLLTGDLFMTFSKRRRNTWWSFFFFFESQDNPCLPGGGVRVKTHTHTHNFRLTNLLLPSEPCSSHASIYNTGSFICAEGL